jgi:MerR family copper efflux transcriptional regulator
MSARPLPRTQITPEPARVATLSIGKVARGSGVAIDTIRFYEREGLLPEPLRRASGYRTYDSSAVQRLRFIRRAKNLGFSLDEIRELLALSQDREHGVEAVKQRATARLADLDRRVRELNRIRRGLRELVDACPGHGVPEQCPILRALGDIRDIDET